MYSCLSIRLTHIHARPPHNIRFYDTYYYYYWLVINYANIYIYIIREQQWIDRMFVNLYYVTRSDWIFGEEREQSRTFDRPWWYDIAKGSVAGHSVRIGRYPDAIVYYTFTTELYNIIYPYYYRIIRRNPTSYTIRVNVSREISIANTCIILYYYCCGVPIPRIIIIIHYFSVFLDVGSHSKQLKFHRLTPQMHGSPCNVITSNHRSRLAPTDDYNDNTYTHTHGTRCRV